MMGWDFALMLLAVWVSPTFLYAILHLCSVRKPKKCTSLTKLNLAEVSLWSVVSGPLG